MTSIDKDEDDIKFNNINLLAIIQNASQNLFNHKDEKILSYVKNINTHGLINITHELIKTEFKNHSLSLNDKENILENVLKIIVKTNASDDLMDKLNNFIDDVVVPSLLHLLEGIYYVKDNITECVEECVIDKTEKCCKKRCKPLCNWLFKIRRRWCCCC
jgi:hypothetical protein